MMMSGVIGGGALASIDLIYKFNPPSPSHGGCDGGADDNQWSSLLDIDSDYTTLIANIDNIVPYSLPSILEQDATNNQGMISPGPDHDYIISSNDRFNSNTMDMKRRRRRRKPPLPSPLPSYGHALIRHNSSLAHLLSRIAMEEMHEMEMEMEMEMETETETEITKKKEKTKTEITQNKKTATEITRTKMIETETERRRNFRVRRLYMIRRQTQCPTRDEMR